MKKEVNVRSCLDRLVVQDQHRAQPLIHSIPVDFFRVGHTRSKGILSVKVPETLVAPNTREEGIYSVSPSQDCG